MALIEYIKREDATGQIAEVYKSIEERMKIVPNVIQFHTASPEMFGKIMNVFNHYSNHQSLNPVLVSYIRLLISNVAGGEYCVRFQSALLLFMGISENDLKIAKDDYNKVNLDSKNKSMLCFVLDEMFDKITNAEKRIEELRTLGWNDQEIYEASVLGALQKGMVQLIKTFKIKIDF